MANLLQFGLSLILFFPVCNVYGQNHFITLSDNTRISYNLYGKGDDTLIWIGSTAMSLQQSIHHLRIFEKKNSWSLSLGCKLLRPKMINRACTSANGRALCESGSEELIGSSRTKFYDSAKVKLNFSDIPGSEIFSSSSKILINGQRNLIHRKEKIYTMVGMVNSNRNFRTICFQCV